MKEINIPQIQGAFGQVTFERGMGYYENGYVLMGIKKGNKLTGTVTGAMPEPFVLILFLELKILKKHRTKSNKVMKILIMLDAQWIYNLEQLREMGFYCSGVGSS